MTAERRRRGAQRLDTSESTRHPGQPCIEQAAPTGRSTLWPAAIARSLGFSPAIEMTRWLPSCLPRPAANSEVTRPGSGMSFNGKAERLDLTLECEWAYARPYTSN
jgi:hypothetical protein